jgi:hypothetical protein
MQYASSSDVILLLASNVNDPKIIWKIQEVTQVIMYCNFMCLSTNYVFLFNWIEFCSELHFTLKFQSFLQNFVQE